MPPCSSQVTEPLPHVSVKEDPGEDDIDFDED